MTVRHTFRKE